jgi:hypothetical protein
MQAAAIPQGIEDPDDNTGVAGDNLCYRARHNIIERRVTLEGSCWVDRHRNEGDALHYALANLPFSSPAPLRGGTRRVWLKI